MTVSPDPAASRVAPCPICGKSATGRYRPFCSPRCRNIDLGRWLNGAYRVETDEGPDEPEGGETSQVINP